MREVLREFVSARQNGPWVELSELALRVHGTAGTTRSKQSSIARAIRTLKAEGLVTTAMTTKDRRKLEVMFEAGWQDSAGPNPTTGAHRLATCLLNEAADLEHARRVEDAHTQAIEDAARLTELVSRLDPASVARLDQRARELIATERANRKAATAALDADAAGVARDELTILWRVVSAVNDRHKDITAKQRAAEAAALSRYQDLNELVASAFG